MFGDKTLTYYRGNYDTFEAVKEEKIKNQVQCAQAACLACRCVLCPPIPDVLALCVACGV
jgi:hypothetical protein